MIAHSNRADLISNMNCAAPDRRYSLGVVLFELLMVFGSRMERAVMIEELRRDSRQPESFKAAWPKESFYIRCAFGRYHVAGMSRYCKICQGFLEGTQIQFVFDWPLPPKIPLGPQLDDCARPRAAADRG